jgi:uncharacterized protein involved in exopolysaccharide biosynthesis
MADFGQLDSELDQIAQGVAELAKEIADLKAQVASQPVTQAQLDALDVKAHTVLASIGSAK